MGKVYSSLYFSVLQKFGFGLLANKLICQTDNLYFLCVSLSIFTDVPAIFDVIFTHDTTTGMYLLIM